LCLINLAIKVLNVEWLHMCTCTCKCGLGKVVKVCITKTKENFFPLIFNFKGLSFKQFCLIFICEVNLMQTFLQKVNKSNKSWVKIIFAIVKVKCLTPFTLLICRLKEWVTTMATSCIPVASQAHCNCNSLWATSARK
jgi:hypothetical protein